jgi:hypothetical protein
MNTGFVAPAINVPPAFVAVVFLYHWYVFPEPVAVTAIVAVIPLIQTFCAVVEGCAVMAVATFRDTETTLE